MNKVIFENTEYPIRNIMFPFGDRTVGSEILNSVLMNEDGAYVSEEARLVDELIFFFVKESDLHLPESQLSQKIISEI